MTFRELIVALEPYFWHDTPLSWLLNDDDEILSDVEAQDVIGDTMALFLVRELRDTYDPSISDKKQLLSAHKVVERAQDDLLEILLGLSTLSLTLKEKEVP